MAPDGRKHARATGPGRGTPRSWPPARSRRAPALLDTKVGKAPRRRSAERAFSVPPRVVALLVIFALLAFSYASSLRVYVNQQHTIAQAQQQVAERQAAVDRLTDELTRWADPNYVRAQARDRLGWVVPGDVGYQVIDLDGRRIGSEVTDAMGAEEVADEMWWDRLWGSVRAADLPVPVTKPSPTAIQTIRVSPQPTASKS